MAGAMALARSIRRRVADSTSRDWRGEIHQMPVLRGDKMVGMLSTTDAVKYLQSKPFSKYAGEK